MKIRIALTLAIAFIGLSVSAQNKAEEIYAEWKMEQQVLLKHNLDEMCIRQGVDSMKFTMQYFGEKPADGWSLWISLHGGGGVPVEVNDQQWENQKRLYKPKEGIYVCPRSPQNVWNMWCTNDIDPMYEELIRTLVVCKDVNPDKVYINGYSAGGDGVWRLAPRMADHWAAAAMMAGHPGDVRLENVRNLPFTIWVGSEDAAYDRNKLVPLRGLELDSLQRVDPDGYIHETHVMEGLPHWMLQRDTVALDWMRQFRRNPHPTRVVWRQEEVLKQWFYWLEAPTDELKRGKTVVAEIKGNNIYIIRCDYSRLTVYLAEGMLDLDKSVTIVMPNGKKKTVKPHRSEKTLRETLKARGDKGFMFPVKFDVNLSQVFTYKAPVGAVLKDDYNVYVRMVDNQSMSSPEGWTKIDTYMAKVNAPIENKDDTVDKAKVNTGHAISEISYAYFDFEGQVEVKVVCKHKTFKNVKIRPKSKNIGCNIVNDSTMQFVLIEPENVSIEFDGNIRDNLLLFTSKPQQSMAEAKMEAKKSGRKFVYIPHGYYDEANMFSLTSSKQRNHLTISKDTIVIPSNTTVYVAPGTYIKGTFLFESVHDASVIGRSVARPNNGYGGCMVCRSKNIMVDGIITNQCPIGGSEDVMVTDCRSISHPGWGDGMNVFASSNVTFDRVFIRSSDDCTTAYATRKGFYGSVNNICMKNSTLWADVAHPIFIGIHGDAVKMDSIMNLHYENIDILGQSELQLDYQGCLAINCGDNNLVKNVTFDDIRIENIEHGCPIQLKVGFNSKYCAAPGRGIENVLFRNVQYNGTNMQQSMILGYTEERTVKGITFEGFKINGKYIYDDMPNKPKWYKTADMANIYINDHVKEIVFK